MKNRLIVLCIIAAGIFYGAASSAQPDITARVTVDNAYAFGWGDANSILPNNYWPQASTGALAVINTLAGDIYNCVATPPPSVPVPGPELYPNLHPTITDYMYIVGFSDLSVQQGAIGHFRDNNSGQILGSGNPNWQVFATGVSTGANQAPTLTQVNAQIALANNNQGPATSSVGWVGPNAVSGRIGRLVTTAQGSGLPALPCIDPNAQWMWYQDDLDPRGTAFNAFTMQPQAPGRSREFLIFRLPVQAIVAGTGFDIQATKSACPLTPGVTAYGLTVTNLGQTINGPAQIEILEFVPPGLTVAVAVTPPWQCTPTNAVGPDVITCKYNLPAGSTIAQGAALPPIMVSATGEARCPNCMRAKLYMRGREGELALVSEANTTNNVSCK